MKKLLKRIHEMVICYDPIIEILKEDQVFDGGYSQSEKHYLASPVQPNRKQKRDFCYRGNTKEISS